jgi:hypothetical protein
MPVLCACAVSGLEYSSHAAHEKWHTAFFAQSAKFEVPAFGERLWTFPECEEEKDVAWSIVIGKELQPKVRMVAVERILYAWFCRSVTNTLSLDHPEFAEYCAMMLAHDKAIQRYGSKPGHIRAGTYYAGASEN